jgi:hypothetical protein
MVRFITALSVVALVAGCGGTRYSSSNEARNTSYTPRAVFKSATAPTARTSYFASGPISAACKSAGRKQATRSRCGCVQAVANQSLSRSEQIRGAAFFKDPQKAQDLRQSGGSANERFWKKWKAYGQEAARICT